MAAEVAEVEVVEAAVLVVSWEAAWWGEGVE